MVGQNIHVFIFVNSKKKVFNNYYDTKPYIFPFHINQLGFQDPETQSPSEVPKFEDEKKKPVILESIDGKYVFFENLKFIV